MYQMNLCNVSIEQTLNDTFPLITVYIIYDSSNSFLVITSLIWTVWPQESLNKWYSDIYIQITIFKLIGCFVFKGREIFELFILLNAQLTIYKSAFIQWVVQTRCRVICTTRDRRQCNFEPSYYWDSVTVETV